MPVQPGWVELWLNRYCPPGHHALRVARPGLNVCEVCGKEELAGGHTCMICGIPGEFPHVLEHQGERLSGRLCGPCMDDFEARRSIEGWRVAG